MGLDIGTSGVRAAQLSIGKRGATLERFGQVALPPGAVVAGEVVDPPAVSASIKQLWSQARFSSKKVFAGVSNGKVIVRQVDLAYTPLPELRKSLPLQVQDVIPMPVEQAILDAHPLEEMVAEDGARGLRVLLVAAGRDMVAGHVAAIQGAGLTPAGIDLNSFALLRSLARPDEMGFGATAEALVDVGASVTNITVHQAGVARFVRILLMGGNDLTQSVAERMGVPMEQAEAAKQEHGLALPPDASGIRASPHSRRRPEAGSTKCGAASTTTSRNPPRCASAASSSPVGDASSPGWPSACPRRPCSPSSTAP